MNRFPSRSTGEVTAIVSKLFLIMNQALRRTYVFPSKNIFIQASPEQNPGLPLKENYVGATLDRNENVDQKIESKFQITPWRGTINTATVTQTVTTATTNHGDKKTDICISIFISIGIRRCRQGPILIQPILIYTEAYTH
jgi:hypothetical protein